MNNVIEKTEGYYSQFQDAQTDNERQILALDYKAYYNQLTEEDKIVADKIHNAHFAETQRMIAEMEPVLQWANDKLNRHQQPA